VIPLLVDVLKYLREQVASVGVEKSLAVQNASSEVAPKARGLFQRGVVDVSTVAVFVVVVRFFAIAGPIVVVID